MSDSTLTLTFSDLIIRAAEFLGIAYYGAGGDEAAQVPTDAHDLDLCKRLVNDGYRKFINANPNWAFLSPLTTITFSPRYAGTAASGTTTTIVDTTLVQPSGVSFVGMTIGIYAGTGITQTGTISAYNAGTGTITFGAMTIAPDSTSRYSIAPAKCVAGDNSRYYLPDGFFGSMLSPWTYDSAGPRISLEMIHEGRIRELLAGASYQGTPRLIAVRPIGADPTTNGKRWEAIFYPAPQSNYNVTARLRLYPDALSTLTDRPICGYEHEEALLSAILSEAEKQRNDTIGIHAQAYQEALARAMNIDKQAAPRRLGSYGDTSDDRLGNQGRRPLSFYSVDTYNGTAL